MRRTMRKLAGLLTVVLCLSLGVLTVPAGAAATQNLTALLAAGTIKPLGRTQVNAAGTGITADWSGSGFDVNVTGGGKLTVGYKASYSNYWAVLVDGEQIWRDLLSANTSGGTFSVTIPAGAHTVRVVKETQISTSTTAYSMLTTLAFDGTIVGAPEKKDIYIEFVGDSYSCGDGAIGTYTPGVKWLAEEDSATHAFTYYTAQELDADYSIVARGGIGLYTGVSAEEGTWNAVSMPGIYQNVSGYNSNNGAYGFEREPDVVVIELGANDSVNASKKAEWTGLMKAFVKVVREKNPNASILLTSHAPIAYSALMDVVKQLQAENAVTYAKLHTFFYDFLGTGSAALATQYAGHIGVDDNIAFAKALANFIKSEDLIPEKKANATYNDITYYVSENGNDSNDGKTIETAKLTLNAAFVQAKADNGNSTYFADGTRIKIYVEGTVLTNTSNSQVLGGTELLRKTGGTIRDHIPVVLTTYDYSGERATIQINHAPTQAGNDSVLVYNDMEFKDIALYSETSEKGFASRRLYASGCHLVFDNASLTTDGLATGSKQWFVSAERFTNSGIVTADSTESLYGTVTFRNGDYTNLDYVSAVTGNGIWISNELTLKDAPYYHAKVVIEDGAKMGTVYNRYGTLGVGSAKVEIHGGEVAQYVGTADGTDGSRKTYPGDVDLLITGGHIAGTHFSTAGRFVTIDGDINTEITGGIFSITPKDTSSQYDSYLFGGRQKCYVDNINTTISGGQFYLFFDVANVESSWYFGVSGGGTVKNVTNRISGGAFLPIARGATGKDANVYFGCHTGSITGTLTNEISGGNFVFSLSGLSERAVNFGSKGVNLPIGKVINVIGKEGTNHGPTFVGASVRMAAGWAQVGTSTKMTAEPTTCSDEVVVSNTIYGGEFNSALYMGASTVSDASKSRYSFIKGSIENNIYGGFFMGDVYGGGKAAVYGNVTTNIYGGHFKSIYAGQASGENIYDGVVLNVCGMQEYYPISPTAGWVVCAGNKSGTVPAPMTAGREAIELMVAPVAGANLVMKTPITVGVTEGTSCAAIADCDINFTANPEANLPTDAPYYVEYLKNGGYQMIKGYRNAGEFIDFGSSLAFTLYLQADNGVVSSGDSLTVVQNKEGESVTLSGENVSVEQGTGKMAGKLIVTVSGIAAKEMRDDLTFTLTKDGEMWFSETMSIYDAVMAWYEDSGDVVYKTMLANMLNYGRAAQEAFDYNVSGMGEAMLTSTQSDWGEVDLTHGVSDGYADQVAITLSLKERVELNVYVNDKAAEIDEVTIGEGEEKTTLAEGTDYTVDATSGSYTRIVFHNIPVRDVKQTVNFKVTLSDGEFRVKYGIKDYVVTALQDAENTQHDLLEALQKYVDSVSAFLKSQWVTPGEDETAPLPIKIKG